MSSTPNKSATPVLKVLEALCGFAASGATNKDLAAACKTTPVAVTRATQVLIENGWCRKNEETQRFFPTTIFTKLVFHVHDDFNRVIDRLEDQRRAMAGGVTTQQRQQWIGDTTKE